MWIPHDFDEKHCVIRKCKPVGLVTYIDMLIVNGNLYICLLYLSNQIFVAFFLKKIDIRSKIQYS